MQDQTGVFDADVTVFDWMRQWAQEGDDEQIVRATLGRLLFSGDDGAKNGARALRRRERADAVRQADAARGRTCW